MSIAMRDDRPSTTAAIVAFARAAAAGDQDQVTRDLVPLRYRKWLENAAKSGFSGSFHRGVVATSTLGLTGHMRLRTASIDEAVEAAVAQGVRQVVVLGAGLDVRAHRMASLKEAVVYEVDHPASQQFKRQRIGQHATAAREVRYVTVDFERQEMTEPLLDAGFDASEPSFWIWEGVTMYLETAAMIASLESIARLSAPGSGLAVTYLTGNMAPLGLPLQGIIHKMFGAIDEPLVGLIETDVLHDHLERAGFVVEQDGCSRQWVERHGGSSLLPLPFRAERLAIVGRVATSDEAKEPTTTSSD